MKSEREKMIAGEMYNPMDPELVRLRLRARELTARFNGATPAGEDARQARLRQLFGTLGEGTLIEPPFRCDYGVNIHAGPQLFMNVDCVLLDVCEICIGRQVQFGPGVHVYTADHPLGAAERNSGREFGRPVHIGDRAWIGGRAVILPGVTIGEESVIGAGSVVTRSIPAGVVAAGNPCRVLRDVPNG